MLILWLIGLSLLFWYFFVPRKPENFPDGPWLRVPILGHFLHVGSNPTAGYRKLRQKFGDIFALQGGSIYNIVVSDFKIMEEMVNKDVFNGRVDLDAILKINIAPKIRGGNGIHGLISTYGPVWKEQRRFALKTLRDFGFGKASMEEVIMDEGNMLIEIFKEKAESGDELLVSQLFNISALNVIWRIITGKRCDIKDPKQKAKMDMLSNLMASFGVGSAGIMLLAGVLPGFLTNKMLEKFGGFFKECFDWFEEEYKEHEQTYDPNHMRDYIDVYMRERKRAETEKDTTSSFYGENGHYNYLNSMFDLFLTGSETTSTFMTFALLYLVHFPRVQRRLQDELDQAVGRSRSPQAEDKPNLPYLEAFLTELQRHSVIAPFSVQHSVTEDTVFRGYNIPKHTVITFNQYEIMRDPVNFANPDLFDPERFLVDGKFQPDPKMIAFGLGKRECLGKTLAKQETFLLTANLLHHFSFEPGTGPLPGLDDVTIGITRSPKPFSLRVVNRF